MMDPLSKAEAERLFKENAVLMGGSDGLPVQIAEGFLSAEAIDTTKGLRNAKGKLYNSWCNGRGQCCEYLTETGFFMAVTLYNVSLVGAPNCQAETVIDITTRKRARSYAHKKSRLSI